MSVTRVLQRVVLPTEGDLDVLPLYVEGTQGRVTAVATAGGQSVNPVRQVTSLAGTQRLDQVVDRRTYRVLPQSRTSFATYFNAFPAGYWQHWTVVSAVQLRMTVTGPAGVMVYRSNAKGNIQRIASNRVATATPTDVAFDLPLDRFMDGGWYWFDVLAGDRDALVTDARWESQVSDDRPVGTVTVAITTLNRPDDVVELLAQLGSDKAVLPRLDQVIVVDQGMRHPEDAAAFDAANERLGGRLRVIRQANLGGSGGFSRGMVEALDEGRSDYVLISDDDVRSEPEGILRAATFADLAVTSTIVGGHMFSMYDRSYLHSMGEFVQPWRFWWGPVIKGSEGHHLDESGLRTTPELHRRIDVDYNGWWNCLIPTTVIRKLGLSLPFFIKWDDAEYGLRARDAGIPTVSLPGVAVWHVPWTDKDDSLDWQAYYHARNRIVAALVHSKYERGGRVARESMIVQLKHLLASQYSVAELRAQALEDLLTGPEHMHRDLATRLLRIRETRAHFDDAKVERDPTAFPAARRQKLPRHGEEFEVSETRASVILAAGSGVIHQLSPTRKFARDFPEARIAAADARWWRLSQYDSAVVSTSDGTGASWYHRDPKRFRALLVRSLRLHNQLLRDWPKLAAGYRSAMVEVVSPEAWRETFANTSSAST